MIKSKLKSITRLGPNDNSVRQQLRDLVGTQLFDTIFKESISVAATNQIIESYVDSMIKAASGVSQPRSVTEVINTMTKINPTLTKLIFKEDSDSTNAQSPAAHIYTVTYKTDDHVEHTVDMRAFSPRSIRRRLEQAGYEVRDIVLAATGESVLDESMSKRDYRRAVESAAADIEFLKKRVVSEQSVFSKNRMEAELIDHVTRLHHLIEGCEAVGMRWCDVQHKLIDLPKQPTQVTPVQKKFSLADVLA